MQIQTPDWVKHAVFYQIFPDRFARSKQPRKRLLHEARWEDWEAMPTLQGYKGGDLWGILEGLDYIQSLGINAIYFTPIFQSASNHRYHTHDYYQVDPLLGGNEAFKELLEAAHQRNIKVVLDGVFNHSSRGFFFFHDVLENGPHSPWVNWFKIHGWPLSAYNGDFPANYEGWADNRALPAFNHNNPEVREYIMEIAEYWMKFGIDGWRLDVPFEVKAPGFWQEFRERVKAINPEAYIVGEVWGDSREWLDGTQFDGVMNYLFAGPTIAFTAGDRVVLEQVQSRDYQPYPPLFAAEYATKIQELLQLYPWEIQLTQLNLLASHDTARLMTIAGGDKASIELSTLLLLTFPGAPSIYYGDEVGLPGAIDPDSRRGFPLEANWDQEILQTHRQLIEIRHAYPALRTGDYQVLYAQGTLYVFARKLGTEELIIAVNAGTASVKANIDIASLQTQPSKLLFGHTEFEWNTAGETKQLSLTVPPRTGCILA
ncbi:glycoside hydrolase family 13 protein [Nostoc sp. FACHB-87]|uniref:glycoside hydrolase family 13 protein n=1 Tax=Nostocaceae TaxID=1162 RepID=UPI00168689FE|nr:MULTISPECIES: glycoside hydrolase family 13 protein [Nostocaceae]MBD2456063.1 glycoside hydrolase family 13 protein [Nostoc sp. FACHB-87]MBD2476514.1 glycoside hydrolase family 13 protein [Anabaena sp. FACHB-83]